MGVSFNNTSGYRINHNLTPLDILAGGDLQVIWQSLGDSSSKEGRGGEKGIAANARSGKNNQVPLGCPLGSRHPNIGMSWISGESSVTNVDQNRGHSGCLGMKGLGKCVMSEAEHKAGPRGRRGVVSTELSCEGFRAKGWVRGAWSGLCFCGNFRKRHLLLTLFLAHCLCHYSRGNKVDRGRGGGRECRGDNGLRHQIHRNLGKFLGLHLALFQGVWCQSVNMRGRHV